MKPKSPNKIKYLKEYHRYVGETMEEAQNRRSKKRRTLDKQKVERVELKEKGYTLKE